MSERTAAAASISIELRAEGLPSDVVAKLSRDLQHALLSQIADITPGRAARIELGPPDADDPGLPRGSTDGIVAQFENPD
jgi:hypothetical protein